MAEPPSYEESTSGVRPLSEKGDGKTPRLWSIREQVGLSRSQNVASIVSQIVEHIRDRAQQGLSKTTLVLIPSDQDASRKGEAVGFPEDDVPTMIQFDGRQNSTQFWAQDEALSELKAQLLHAVSDGMPVESTREQPREEPMQPPKKTSWFGRKASKGPEIMREVRPIAASPVKVGVELDEIYFRSETEYGLYETLRVKVVRATVDVR
ncbi:hypothetical protein Q7P37_009246 [Cladosporium fusiforme]